MNSLLKEGKLFLNTNADSLITLFLVIFFFNNFIHFITDINISFGVFIFLAILVTYRIITKFPSKWIFIVLIAYSAFLFIGVITGIYYKLPLTLIISQLFYYLKPPAFFLFGYYFVSEKAFHKTVEIIFWIMFITTPFFMIFPKEFIEFSRIRLRALGYPISDSEYFSGTLITGIGVIPRNPSLLFSYLDTSYALFFLSAYYTNQIKTFVDYKNIGKTFTSIVIFLTTFTRSAIGGLGLAIAGILFFKVKNFKQKATFIAVLGIITTFIILIFWSQIYYLLVKQVSAIVHWENIWHSIVRIVEYPLGSGLGSAGWSAIKSSSVPEIFFYAEGGIFTAMIELGLQFIIWFFILGYIVWRISPKFLFPLYMGFLLISIVLPIPFSTQFTLLFFVYLGTTLQHNSFVVKPKVKAESVIK